MVSNACYSIFHPIRETSFEKWTIKRLSFLLNLSLTYTNRTEEIKKLTASPTKYKKKIEKRLQINPGIELTWRTC